MRWRNLMEIEVFKYCNYSGTNQANQLLKVHGVIYRAPLVVANR